MFMEMHLIVGLITTSAYLAGYRSSTSYSVTVPGAGEGTAIVLFIICLVFLLGVTALFTVQS
jgi:hypothetical protein